MKILIDTNIWISYLIGKTLAELDLLINDSKIEIIISDELINELKETFEKKRIKKYFQNEKFSDFWIYINKIKLNINLVGIPQICRDKDDNIVLALADQADCEYIITGDKDLLVLEQYKDVKILKFRDFMINYFPLRER